jgi:hypothetical protein
MKVGDRKSDISKIQIQGLTWWCVQLTFPAAQQLAAG